MDASLPELDHALVRAHFAHAAPTYGEAAVLAREVERRMLERLDYIKLSPARILDAGCGQGAGLRQLARRYARAELLGVDAVPAMLRAMQDDASLLERARAVFGGRAPQAVCGDMGALPLVASSVGLVWSNCGLAWAGDALVALREFGRVLETGGLLMFSTYGPDTLKELRTAFAGADAAPHVHSFIDMHDLGDMLVACGFATPVMDMETITLTYADVAALARDLKASGQTNALATRRRTLLGKGRWQRMASAYERLRQAGRLPASFEIVYGHAWKGEPRATADGRAIVKLEMPRKRPAGAP